MSAHSEVDKLANYIMAAVPGEPSANEGACETAIRLIRGYRRSLKEIERVLLLERGLTPSPALGLVQNALIGIFPFVFSEDGCDPNRSLRDV